MKFLSKKQDSQILAKGLIYKENRADNNKKLLELLIAEQKNFCAYTEKYFEELDSPEVEHFNSSLKYNDDYYNYYAVISKANLYKKDEKYKNESFFKTLFFQSEQELNKRIKFEDSMYISINEKYNEAKEFIDFLGLNDNRLYTQRKRHIYRFKKSFEIAKSSSEDKLNYFKENKDHLSFITALESVLKINLAQLLDEK